MDSNKLRQSFLDFFINKKHALVESSPVVPYDDPTLLFTNAGMNQFKDALLGTSKRKYNRAVSVQKCIRAGGKHNDLDEVGHDGRHCTFFEMLGNWSFGDYFKKEAIAWAWEYVTETIKLDKNKLYVSVYKTDDEAYDIWNKEVGIKKERIYRLGDLEKGDEENFWSMGDTGPCGYCSEIYYDQGESLGCGKKTCIPGCSCDRFSEIWNLVFITYNRDKSGKLDELKQKGVDTGLGLERVAAILQNKDNVFDTDLFLPIISEISRLTKKDFKDKKFRPSMNVIADHLRSLSFALADGGVFSNEGRGYVLRRILRRAVRYARNLGTKEPMIFRLVDLLVSNFSDIYPEIKNKKNHVQEHIKIEEEKFLKTIDRGMDIFNEEIAKLQKNKETIIPGKTVFLLHDTYGFPVDLTEIMSDEIGFSIDIDGYNKEMEKQKTLSAKHAKFYQGADDSVSWNILSEETNSQFFGYELLEMKASIVKYRNIGKHYELVLDGTPFYAESGGQVGDKGKIYSGQIEFEVMDTIKQENEFVHVCKLIKGSFEPSKPVKITAEIDKEKRCAIQKNHTATHLLHRALKNNLGEDVNQSGSKVASDYLRFDFNYHKKISPEVLVNIELDVNKAIWQNRKIIKHADVPIKKAKEMGAVAIFGEKYSEKVRVVEVDDYSKELCGGTHVENTGEIGLLLIASEGSIASGIRRIVAVTGEYAEQEVEKRAQVKLNITDEKSYKEFKRKEKDNLKKIEKKKTEEIKTRKIDKNQKLQEKFNLIDRTIAKEEKIIFEEMPDSDYDDLLSLTDRINSKLPSNVSILFSETKIVVRISDDLVKKGLNASKILKDIGEIAGAKGGGRPNLARGALFGKESAEKLINSRNEIKKKINKFF